jgi:RNA recognition motif-containing protein
MRTLYIGGLTPDMNTEKLHLLFSRFGELADARVVMRGSTGTCRGFGYVSFLMERDALTAMEQLDGTIVRGHQLRVDLAR